MVLVTSRDYQLEAGDREARYVMLGNIVSGVLGSGQILHSHRHYSVRAFMSLQIAWHC